MVRCFRYLFAFQSNLSAKCHYDFAEAGVGFHTCMRIADFVCRINTIDDWTNRAARHQRENGRGKAPRGLGFFFDRAPAKHRADNRRSFSHEQSEVDLRFRARRRADTNKPAACTQPITPVIAARLFSATLTNSACSPPPVIPKTRSPIFQVRTSWPTDSTPPANSKPGMFVG